MIRQTNVLLDQCSVDESALDECLLDESTPTRLNNKEKGDYLGAPMVKMN